MPSIRIGFSTDFNLTGEQIGIGTTNPTARLDVAGQILSDDSAGSGGVSTVTRYAGFLDEAQGLGNNVSIAETTKGNLNSLSGEIKISGEVTVTEDTKLTGGRLDSLTVTGKFDLPQGGTEDREDTPEKGSTRFNQDLGQLEFYTGYEWRTVNSYADIRNSPSGRGRGVFAGGDIPGSTRVSTIDFVNIQTTGNSKRFGDLTQARSDHNRGVVSSGSRGIFAGGSIPPTTYTTIDYITIASEGNAIDFGDTGAATITTSACSSSTRGLFAGGYSPSLTNVIEYIEISTIGNALDFGDLSNSRTTGSGFASPTRGIFGGGVDPAVSSRIDFVTISSKGNAIIFGDLTQARRGTGSCASSTRGLFMGGSIPGYIKTIDYVTTASTGNALTFGDLAGTRGFGGAAGSQTRALIAAGYSGSAYLNSIEYVTISSSGDAQDFGDLSYDPNVPAGCSDSHGGLGGF